MFDCNRIDEKNKSSPNKKGVEPPAAFFIPASLTITDYLNSKSLIMMVDGRSYVGEIMYFDVLGNILVDDCVERIFVDDKWSDDPISSTQIIKSENIAMICEIISDEEMNNKFKHVNFDKISQLQKLQIEKYKKTNRKICKDEFQIPSDHPFNFTIFDEF